MIANLCLGAMYAKRVEPRLMDANSQRGSIDPKTLTKINSSKPTQYIVSEMSIFPPFIVSLSNVAVAIFNSQWPKDRGRPRTQRIVTSKGWQRLSTDHPLSDFRFAFADHPFEHTRCSVYPTCWTCNLRTCPLVTYCTRTAGGFRRISSTSEFLNYISTPGVARSFGSGASLGFKRRWTRWRIMSRLTSLPVPTSNGGVQPRSKCHRPRCLCLMIRWGERTFVSSSVACLKMMALFFTQRLNSAYAKSHWSVRWGVDH